MIRMLKNNAHRLEAVVANLLYGLPAKKIPTIGITGTDGKTTTTSLVFHILKTAGFNPAMISTVGAQIGGKDFETGLHTTTPSSFILQKYIKKAVDLKCNFLVLETTSHALDQGRVTGIDFKIGVLTNITHEHLDYHGTYENYVKAKSRLFLKSDISIINKNDDSYPILSKRLKGRNVLTYSLSGNADFTLSSIGIVLPSKYDFNNENFLAAISVAKTLKIPDEKISEAIATFKFPQGRQEIVYDKDFQVIIDFAHTPNSFEKILSSVRRNTKGRLIHVFGAAGQRDQSKRSLMGASSAKYSDVIVLTAEDPRKEKIMDINTQIGLGISSEFERTSEVEEKGKYMLEIDDRKNAIKKAISIASKGDTVLITGKGHEKSMNLGGGEIPWSDHQAVDDAIKTLNI